MTERAGPPSPRPQEPWQPAPVEPALEQYAARDAACAEWVERIYGHTVSPRETMIAKTAFCAGWSARKQAQYAAVVNHPYGKSVDIYADIAKTLFPTDAEIEGKKP